MIALFPIFASGRIRTSLRVVEVLSSASSRSLPEARRKGVFSLCMPLFLFILNHDSAGAEDPASYPPATPPPATRSAREGPRLRVSRPGFAVWKPSSARKPIRSGAFRRRTESSPPKYAVDPSLHPILG